MTPSLTSSTLWAAIQTGTPGTFKPTRKPDDSEQVLGRMSPELQCIWEQREYYHRATEELAHRFSDRARMMMSDVREQGDKLASDALTGYKEGLKKILLDMKGPAKFYSVLNGIFHSLARLDFGMEDDCFFAVREGYILVCRPDDNRNDNRPPYLDITSELSVGKVGIARLMMPDPFGELSKLLISYLDELGSKQEPPAAPSPES